MTDPRSRPHDHLVEPMFAALHSDGVQPPPRPVRGSLARRVLFWLVAVSIASAAIWTLAVS